MPASVEGFLSAGIRGSVDEVPSKPWGSNPRTAGMQASKTESKVRAMMPEAPITVRRSNSDGRRDRFGGIGGSPDRRRKGEYRRCQKEPLRKKHGENNRYNVTTTNGTAMLLV